MYYTTSLLEDWIKDFYYSIDIFHPHQLDFLDIATRLGIVVSFEKMSSRFYDGEILIEDRLSSQEQWQDFAHELCHVLRHEGNQLFMPKPFLELQEYQANHFTYHFCIPTFMLLKTDLPKNLKQAIYYTANTFNVTLEFAEFRLEHFRNQLEASKIQGQFTQDKTNRINSRFY